MKSLLFLAAAVWLSASVCGVIYLTRFESTPSASDTDHPSTFPHASKLKKRNGFPTLVFFAHPKCPCTRAALRELARLLTETAGKATVHVVFTKPTGTGDDWNTTDLHDLARSIPDVEVLTDLDEVETSLFNAGTSSLTLVYDQLDQLRFSGGITAGRGHEGDNAGRKMIADIILNDRQENGETPVFGCPLRKENCTGEAISLSSDPLDETYR